MMRRFLRRVLVTALALFVSVAIYRGVYGALPEYQPKPNWTAASRSPVPNDFLFAMFPTGTVSVFDAANGKPIGTLGRAVVNSQQELATGGWVAVRDGSAASWVPLNQLSVDPPPSAQPLFAAFDAAYKARDPKELRETSLDFSTQGGKKVAKLRLRQEDHWQEYEYEVRDGTARPISMYLRFGPAEALADFGRFVFSAASAVCALLLCAVASVIWWWVARRQSARVNPSTLT